MACQGTPCASRQVDAAFVTVILAGMPAQIYHPRPFAHRFSAESVSATLQIELRYVLSLNFGLARLQQKTHVLEARKKWVVLFEYLHSFKTWGPRSEDVISSLHGGGVAVPYWLFTFLLYSVSCLTLGKVLPLIGLLRPDFPSLLPWVGGSKRDRTRLIDCTDDGQWESTS